MNARLSAVLVLALVPAAQATVVLNEPFNNLTTNGWSDLSTLRNWSGSGAGASAFQTGVDPATGLQALSIAPAALGVAGSSNPLYAWSALDFRLPTPVQHASNTVTIQFTIRFASVSSNGEYNRFIAALVNNYPTGPLTYNDVTPDEPGFNGVYPYGQPTYHLRIRPSTSASSLVQYGGAVTKGPTGSQTNYENTWEWAGDAAVSGAASTYWLPGFNATADSSGKEVSPGTVADFPLSSEKDLTAAFAGLSSTSPVLTAPVTFKYVISPDKQEAFEKRSDQADFVSLGAMSLPLTSTAPAYTYYESFDALRLYFRDVTSGSNSAQTFVSALSVDVTPASTVPEPASLALLVAGAAALLRRRA